MGLAGLPGMVRLSIDAPYEVVEKNRKDDLETRKFIAWDGEGINLQGEGKPQSYVLFGCSEGHVANKKGLNVWDCLNFIIDVGARFPKSISCRFCVFV